MRIEISSVRELPNINFMGHTCANLNGDLLFVWGGTNDEVDNSNNKSIRNENLWIYDTLTGYWRHRVCSGDCPPYLSSSPSCIIQRKMYVFGGHSSAHDNWQNSLYCLDLETFIWTNLSSSPQTSASPTKPIPSDKNVCWTHEDKLYLFGGYGWSQVEHHLDILQQQVDFNIAPDHRWPRFGWNNQLLEYDPKTSAWRWPAYTGKCPSARAAHSGALMGDTYYLFGGRDSNQRLNDLYTFNMVTFEWNLVAIMQLDTSRPLVPPIGHLLESPEDSNAEDYNEHDLVEDLLDEDIVESERTYPNGETMLNYAHDDNVDEEEGEEEVWSPSPSSSSSAAAADCRQQANDGKPSEATTRCSHESPGARSKADYSNYSEVVGYNDDDDDEDFDTVGCPHPSVLMERCSITSSTSTTIQTTLQQVQSQATQDHDRAQADRANEDYLAMNSRQQEPSGAPADVEPPMELFVSIPTGRSFSSFTPISSTEILLYGGVDSQNKKLDDCWLFNIHTNQWTQIELLSKHRRPRLWHTGSRTKQNEVVVLGGSSSDQLDEYCPDVIVLSMEPKSLKRLALDAVSRSIKMPKLRRYTDLPSNITKLIKLRKQALALSMRSCRSTLNSNNPPTT